jgi:hypothetical protein
LVMGTSEMLLIIAILPGAVGVCAYVTTLLWIRQPQIRMAFGQLPRPPPTPINSQSQKKRS